MKKTYTTSILLIALMVLGLSASAQETATVSPVAGMWDYAIETPDGVFRGVLTVADTADALTGSLLSESENGTVYEIETITFTEPDLAFTFPHPQYGDISVELTVDGDELEGTLTVPGEGGFPMTGTRKGEEEGDGS